MHANTLHLIKPDNWTMWDFSVVNKSQNFKSPHAPFSAYCFRLRLGIQCHLSHKQSSFCKVRSYNWSISLPSRDFVSHCWTTVPGFDWAAKLWLKWTRIEILQICMGVEEVMGEENMHVCRSLDGVHNLANHGLVTWTAPLYEYDILLKMKWNCIVRYADNPSTQKMYLSVEIAGPFAFKAHLTMLLGLVWLSGSCQQHISIFLTPHFVCVYQSIKVETALPPHSHRALNVIDYPF